MELQLGVRDHACMARTTTKKRPQVGHFLRAWRESQSPKLTLERVGELLEARAKIKYRSATREFKKLGTSHGNLSRIERGEVPYSQQHLELLADIYGTDPGSLLMRDPSEPAPVYAIWSNIPEDARLQAADVLRTFTRKS